MLVKRPACRTHPANVPGEEGLPIDHDVTAVVDCSTLRPAEVVLRGVGTCSSCVREYTGQSGTQGRIRRIVYCCRSTSCSTHRSKLGPNPLGNSFWFRTCVKTSTLETANRTSHRFFRILTAAFVSQLQIAPLCSTTMDFDFQFPRPVPRHCSYAPLGPLRRRSVTCRVLRCTDATDTGTGT